MAEELDLERLKKLQLKSKSGAKGVPRKKAVKGPSSSGGTDQKVATALKKLQVQALPVTEEVNMFKDDGNVLHFSAPKVHAAINSNTFAIYGNGQNKELTELVPGILNQLGPDSLASLRKLAESYQSMQAGGAATGEREADDDDVPDLVESFEVADDQPKSEAKLEEVSELSLYKGQLILLCHEGHIEDRITLAARYTGSRLVEFCHLKFAMPNKSLILEVFGKFGLIINSGARQWLESMLQEYSEDDPRELLLHLANALTEEEQPIGPSALNRAYEKLQVAGDNATGDVDMQGDEVLPENALRVVSAFAMPRYTFNAERNNFERASSKPVMTGSADAKAIYLRDRYNIIKQTILRSEHFSPPALPGHDRKGDYLKLTGIKNLLGRQGNRFLLFGLLTRTTNGSYCLEDLDDHVVLNMRNANPSVGFYPEGTFVLVDGMYELDATFTVEEIAHPPSEGRAVASSIHGNLDYLGTGTSTQKEDQTMLRIEQTHPNSIVFISDLHLDLPKVRASFRAILKGYEEAGVPPAAFVLCGNFSHAPFLFDGSSTVACQKNFDSLADLIASFPLILEHSHFILVPGPNDPWTSNSLPRPPLPSALTKSLQEKVTHITFASNPCRLLYLSQEIVILREDLMSKFLRNSVCIKSEEDRRQEEIARAKELKERHKQERASGVPEDDLTPAPRSTLLEEYLVQTVLDQAHLCPIALNVKPVLWEFDHALRLYPMPTTLVLADRSSPYELTYELGEGGSEGKCHAFNPGSFVGSSYGWLTYHTDTRRSEPSELPET